MNENAVNVVENQTVWRGVARSMVTIIIILYHLVFIVCLIRYNNITKPNNVTLLADINSRTVL